MARKSETTAKGSRIDAVLAEDARERERASALAKAAEAASIAAHPVAKRAHVSETEAADRARAASLAPVVAPVPKREAASPTLPDGTTDWRAIVDAARETVRTRRALASASLPLGRPAHDVYGTVVRTFERSAEETARAEAQRSEREARMRAAAEAGATLAPFAAPAASTASEYRVRTVRRTERASATGAFALATSAVVRYCRRRAVAFVADLADEAAQTAVADALYGEALGAPKAPERVVTLRGRIAWHAVREYRRLASGGGTTRRGERSALSFDAPAPDGTVALADRIADAVDAMRAGAVPSGVPCLADVACAAHAACDGPRERGETCAHGEARAHGAGFEETCAACTDLYVGLTFGAAAMLRADGKRRAWAKGGKVDAPMMLATLRAKADGGTLAQRAAAAGVSERTLRMREYRASKRAAGAASA